MGGLVVRLHAWWDSADRSQKTITVVGGGFLLALLAATIVFASRPKMETLFSGLDPAQQGQIMAELDKLGIAYETDARGDLLVASDQRTVVTAKLAMAGKLPASVKIGDEDLSKIGLMNTPAVERERLKALAESNLAETIQAMDGVLAATVHLNLGERSAFVRDQQEPTASVTVTEKAGGSVGADQGRTIALLVANSVPGLTIKNVAVVNSRMELLFDGTNASGPGGQIQTKLQTEEAESKGRERELQSKLDSAFGPGTTLAMVNLELDFDHKKTEEVTQTPSEQPISKTIAAEKMGGVNSPGASGIASSTATGVGAPGTGGGGSTDNKYNNNQTETQYLPNSKTTTTDESAGTLKSMSVNVIVNSTKVKNPQLVDSILQGYLGAHLNQDGFSYKVTSADFDTSGAKVATDAAGAAASQQKIQQIVSILPVGALILVAVMVIKSLGKFAKNPTIMVATPDGQMLPLPASGLSLRPSQLRGAEAAGASAGGAVAAAQPAGANVAAYAPANSAAAEAVDVGSIESKINVPLEQIKKMSEERPDVVAVLIKSWLLEDR